jgi:hypothetical protein
LENALRKLMFCFAQVDVLKGQTSKPALSEVEGCRVCRRISMGFTGCEQIHRKWRENNFLDGTKRQGTTLVVP